MSAQSETKVLADYIMAHVPGEPSQNQGAGQTAVRLLKQYAVLLDAVNAYRLTHSKADPTGELDDTYVKMLKAADAFDPVIKKA